MRGTCILVWCALLVCTLGCGDEGGPNERNLTLVFEDTWEPADPATDVFAKHAPDVISCAPGSIIAEPGALDVSTDDCNYLFVAQPLQHRLERGDRVVVEAGHLLLYNPDGPATGHIAVLIGDHVLWERIIPIPAQPALYVEEIIVDQDFELGTQVALHLHNHGANEWRFYSLSRRRP